MKKLDLNTKGSYSVALRVLTNVIGTRSNENECNTMTNEIFDKSQSHNVQSLCQMYKVLAKDELQIKFVASS